MHDDARNDDADPVDPVWTRPPHARRDPTPPILPRDLDLPPDAGEVLRLLRDIWVRATPDTIGDDLERARRLEVEAAAGEAELAHRYVRHITRLARWLRDV